MGWRSGVDVMVSFIERLEKRGVDPKLRQAIYEDLIPALQSQDWDTELDAMGLDPAYDVALRKLHPDWFETDC